MRLKQLAPFSIFTFGLACSGLFLDPNTPQGRRAKAVAFISSVPEIYSYNSNINQIHKKWEQKVGARYAKLDGKLGSGRLNLNVYPNFHQNNFYDTSPNTGRIELASIILWTCSSSNTNIGSSNVYFYIRDEAQANNFIKKATSANVINEVEELDGYTLHSLRKIDWRSLEIPTGRANYISSYVAKYYTPGTRNFDRLFVSLRLSYKCD